MLLTLCEVLQQWASITLNQWCQSLPLTSGQNRDNTETENNNTSSSTERSTESCEDVVHDALQTDPRETEANLTKLLNFPKAFQGDYRYGLEGDAYKITSDYRWFAGLHFFLCGHICHICLHPILVHAMCPAAVFLHYWVTLVLLAVFCSCKEEIYNNDACVFTCHEQMTMFTLYLTTTYNAPSMEEYCLSLL